MTRDAEDAVAKVLGPAGPASSPVADWFTLERELGVPLPGDYKKIVTGYAPAQVNVHLFLRRPSAERWNLGQWMKETTAAFTRSDLKSAKCPGFPEGPLFSGPAGLIDGEVGTCHVSREVKSPDSAIAARSTTNGSTPAASII
ncbi:hypothetical protein [Streptomyces sp. NPDC017202]|uniref:hypothetical protein n=1 Tax=Streptomyces sp. NPDC017202 TaxID=3364981 RepID=UPI0037A6FF26